MNDETSNQELLGYNFSPLIHRILRRTWFLLAIVVITLAIIFSVFRALTPWATQYKSEVEKHLSTILGQPVLISSMETSWYWFQPVLKLNKVTVADDKSHQLKLNKLMVGINLVSSLLHWRIQPGILYADNIHVTVRQLENNSWEIDGFQQKDGVTVKSEEYLTLAHWLLNQQKIIVRNVSALIHLKNGALLPLKAFDMVAQNRDGHIKIKGLAQLAQPTPTKLITLADLNINNSSISKLNGHVYFSIENFVFQQWKAFLPQFVDNVDGGKGNLEVWLDLKKSNINSIQTKIDFKKLAIKNSDGSKIKKIQAFKANLAWLPTNHGWQISGDQINLKMQNIAWPQNSLLIDHNKTQNSYRIYLQHAVIESILKSDIKLPKKLDSILSFKPRGYLEDSQIGFANGEINYILTKFSGISWLGKKNIPGISNLSGVLNWQPQSGRLEIDSEDTAIRPKKLPVVLLKQVNAGITWQQVNQTPKINVDHMVLNQADFVLTGKGLLDETKNLQIDAQFSADNAAKWLAYIPAQFLKPKLNIWLKKDITKINKISAQLKVAGNVNDFPFTEKPGEFSINSHLNGVDLFFNRDWPLCQDIDANIRVNKRTLESDITSGSMHGIPIEQVNLRVDNLGLNHENLIVHGNANASGNQALAYIFNSPLKAHLGKLKALDIQNPVSLDLNLEVPLYPENDNVSAKGVLAFNDNLVNLNLLNKVSIPHFTGDLNFTEDGITPSHFTASLFDEPIQLDMQSLKKPYPHTEINANGNLNINAIKNKFNISLFALTQGHLNLKSQFKLVDDVGHDTIHLASDLQGVTINLPAPFGKEINEKTPLAMDMEFVNAKNMNLQLNYNQKIKANLWLNSQDNFNLSKGLININSQIKSLPENGLKIAGEFNNFDVKKWQDTYEQLPKTNSKITDLISGVDLKFAKLKLWEKIYNGVSVQANKIDHDLWGLNLNQQDLKGQFKYQISKHFLSGKIEKLYLAKSAVSNDLKSFSNLKPLDIPNLDLMIAEMKINEFSLGSVDIQSTSSENKWTLNAGKIKSPNYELNAKGTWQQVDKKNISEFEGNLQIKKLEETLKNLNITPAVEARSGQIVFKGHWPGSIKDFALKNSKADLYMELKNGRITHLSPETEEKIGLGKLLSILSLQTIPRRLKLDFSDLAYSGYSYDIFKGNFVLKNGVMTTTDSYIDGPVAYADMKGDLDVVKQLYNVDLHVSPHITASLPVVATIAGGPIAGVATWVASKIISQSMQTVTGYTYKVTGPWHEPIVQQVSIFKKN